MDSDPQKNVVFSVHFYCGDGENANTVRSALAKCDRKLPLIVGEFGDRHQKGNGYCNVQEEAIMQQPNSIDMDTTLGLGVTMELSFT